MSTLKYRKPLANSSRPSTFSSHFASNSLATYDILNTGTEKPAKENTPYKSIRPLLHNVLLSTTTSHHVYAVENRIRAKSLKVHTLILPAEVEKFSIPPVTLKYLRKIDMATPCLLVPKSLLYEFLKKPCLRPLSLNLALSSNLSKSQKHIHLQFQNRLPKHLKILCLNSSSQMNPTKSNYSDGLAFVAKPLRDLRFIYLQYLQLRADTLHSFERMILDRKFAAFMRTIRIEITASSDCQSLDKIGSK